MRKIVLSTLFIMGINCTLLSQTQKGSLYFGITGSGTNIFDTENNNPKSKETQTAYNFSAGINAGYFIKNNFSIGITGNYSSSLTLTPSSSILIKENVYWYAPISLQLHARKYFILQPNILVYPQLSWGIVTGLSRDMARLDNDDLLLIADGELSGYTANLSMGFTWFPLKKVKRLSVETLVNVLGYQAITNNYKSPSTRNTELKTSFSFFSASFGINYYIFKQKTDK